MRRHEMVRPSNKTSVPTVLRGFLVLLLGFSIFTVWGLSFLLHSSTQNHPLSHSVQTPPQTFTEPIKIAHVISLITCHRADRVQGFRDALVILRHSIHQNSIHHPPANSRYSYQMYALVHAEGGCDAQLPLLRRLGYIPLVYDTPVDIQSINNEWYKQHVEGENCCGSKEFIKLYAYTLMEYPIVVHWDLDVAVLKPMDDLYDAMLYDQNSERGSEARQKLHLQRPQYQTLPDRIDAFFTRDVTSSAPWEAVQAVQGGFVVARPSKEIFQMYRQFILEANYTKGRGPTSGWGGMGYGGFQGAMAYQGVLAYFYDQIYPGHAVELDVCRWNQVVADVIWRGPDHMEYHGQCRQYPPAGVLHENNTPAKGLCQDCRTLPVEETYTVHYTACKKPWECLLPTPRNPRDKRHVYRLKELTNVTTCGLLFRQYFNYRQEVEQLLTAHGLEPKKYEGSFHPEYFMGYCKRAGGYDPMLSIPDDSDMNMIYGF
ncbi:hypothetical protein FisN_29Lh053 [Fistulifera solaris]|uniref:Nucleotide-diphospho-sugar transferase domain-containing protein n=1 Tax=Fistulifera solaris TaxID=1519565 RepID=A0A1Z5JLF1_FISSO|nr:hypothetical protein FisN_29Lh053 [Fistulifera solaris]|eukprot:GAX14845.1 hypothetical protein FisN_29Lh053 [Fistulifera solaris]